MSLPEPDPRPEDTDTGLGSGGRQAANDIRADVIRRYLGSTDITTANGQPSTPATPEEFEARVERAHEIVDEWLEDGGWYVKSRDLAPVLGVSTHSAARVAKRLEDDGVLNPWGSASGTMTWVHAEAPTDEL